MLSFLVREKSCHVLVLITVPYFRIFGDIHVCVWSQEQEFHRNNVTAVEEKPFEEKPYPSQASHVVNLITYTLIKSCFGSEI